MIFKKFEDLVYRNISHSLDITDLNEISSRGAAFVTLFFYDHWTYSEAAALLSLKSDPNSIFLKDERSFKELREKILNLYEEDPDNYSLGAELFLMDAIFISYDSPAEISIRELLEWFYEVLNTNIEGDFHDLASEEEIDLNGKINCKYNFLKRLNEFFCCFTILNQDVEGAIWFLSKNVVNIHFDYWEELLIFLMEFEPSKVTPHMIARLIFEDWNGHKDKGVRSNHLSYDENDEKFFKEFPEMASTFDEYEVVYGFLNEESSFEKRIFKLRELFTYRNIGTGHASNYCLVDGYINDIPYPVGHPYRKAIPEIGYKSVQRVFSFEIKELKNHHREKVGLPRIGEGWIGETLLLNNIKEWFPNLRVIHQWSPEWLGLQRIDIGIPDYNIAIEYHGLQHFEPVDFFGGEEAFEIQKERDLRKKELCDKNNITLLIFTEKSTNDSIINSIEKAIKGK